MRKFFGALAFLAMLAAPAAAQTAKTPIQVQIGSPNVACIPIGNTCVEFGVFANTDTVMTLAPGALGPSPSIAGTLNIASNAPVNPVYFAGLLPNAGQFINLNGLANTAPLVPPANPVGSATAPLAGFISSVVNNAGHGTAGDIIAHYRVAGMFQNTAYAGAASSTGIDIQNNFDATAPTDIPFIGLEVDMANGRTADCVQGAVYCTGIIVTGAPANPNPAFSMMHGYLLEGASPTTWHQGFVIDGGVKDIGFLDESQSATAFEAASIHTTGFLDASHSTNGFVVSGPAGSHTTGVFVAPGSTTGDQFSSNNFHVLANGNINIPTAAITANNVLALSALTVPTATPATSTSACTAGQFSADASFIYTCVATNTWHRLANGATW